MMPESFGVEMACGQWMGHESLEKQGTFTESPTSGDRFKHVPEPAPVLSHNTRRMRNSSPYDCRESWGFYKLRS